MASKHIKKGLRYTLMIVFCGIVLAVLPAEAQDMPSGSREADKTQTQKPAPDTRERRLALAERMHEIWSIRDRVNQALERLAERYAPNEKDSFINAMQLAIDYGRIEEKSIEAMVRTYRVEELQAMVDYYGSEAGQSAEARRSIYQDRIQPVIRTMIDEALMAYRTGETGDSAQ